MNRKALGETVLSSTALILFPMFLALLMIGLGMGIEDVAASFAGYSSIPVRWYFWWTPYLVAFSPSIVGIVSGLLWIQDRQNKFRLAIAIVFFLIDAGSDTYYKAYAVANPTTANWIYAAVDSTIIFTLVSEAFVVSGIGGIIHTYPAFRVQFSDAIRLLFGDHERKTKSVDHPLQVPASQEIKRLEAQYPGTRFERVRTKRGWVNRRVK